MNATGKLRLFLLSLSVLVLLGAWNEGSPSSAAFQAASQSPADQPALSVFDKPSAVVESSAKDSQPGSGPELQETEPAPTVPAITPPPDDDPPPGGGGGGGGGGMNTFVIALLIGLALVAFVGLLLWVASRGRTGP